MFATTAYCSIDCRYGFPVKILPLQSVALSVFFFLPSVAVARVAGQSGSLLFGFWQHFIYFALEDFYFPSLVSIFDECGRDDGILTASKYTIFWHIFDWEIRKSTLMSVEGVDGPFKMPYVTARCCFWRLRCFRRNGSIAKKENVTKLKHLPNELALLRLSRKRTFLRIHICDGRMRVRALKVLGAFGRSCLWS